MATRMEIVRHLPNDRASARIGFVLTDEEAQEVVKKLDNITQRKKDDEVVPYFLSFRDAKDVLHYYPAHLMLYMTFISNYEQPQTEDEKAKTQEGEA